jgi:hypothetical protein
MDVVAVILLAVRVIIHIYRAIKEVTVLALSIIPVITTARVAPTGMGKAATKAA